MDNDQVANVDICLGPVTQAGVSNPPSAFTSCQTIELNNNNVLTGTWSATLEVPISVDYASQKLTLYGIDAAGNRSSQPLETTYWFDSVAPQVAVTSALSTVHLGDYTRTPVPILSGTAGDGSGQVEIVVRLTSPTVGTQRSVVQVQNNQWSYFPDLNFAGDYTISLAAWDAAGNLTSLGTWSLQVTDGYNLWLPRLYR